MQRCEPCPGLLNSGMLLRQPPATPRIQTVAVLWRWEPGAGRGRPPHTHLFFLLWFLRVAPEAETTSKDCGCPTHPLGPERAFPLNSVGCTRCHQRGHFPWKSYQEIFLQRLAVLADENKMFALAICLVLKTSRDNAKALAENRVLSLLGRPQ